MAPRVHNSDANIRDRTEAAKNASLILGSIAPFIYVKWLGEDAPAQEHDDPRVMPRKYEKMRQYWILMWPEAKPGETKRNRKTGATAKPGPGRHG
ncbi:hypothetical protein GCK32_021791 [Trichostrongylus colubriformis]|uniref:Uncharacterized protein n=1 Tax=Trichostrongylus colubriformis TaxID=6319 RepID=A0AAN8G8V9_TRICO